MKTKTLDVTNGFSDASALLESPVKTLSGNMPDGFYSKENKVCYRSANFLFGEDPIEEAPEEVLLVTRSIKGNYGDLLSADRLAKLIADVLNEGRAELLTHLGIRKPAA
jgi:hypothetical protein